MANSISPLSDRVHNNWKAGKFTLGLSDREAAGTMLDIFKWYDNHLEGYADAALNGSAQTRQAYMEFATQANQLKALYAQHLGDFDMMTGRVLDPGERMQLFQNANQVDARLADLKLNGELDRLTNEEPTPPTKKAETAEKPEVAAESKLPPIADPKANGGVYTALDGGALDSVAKGEGVVGTGHKGPGVSKIQQLAIDNHGAKFVNSETGKDYGADGFYGDVTKNEIARLQKGWGLEPSGIVDKETLRRLNMTAEEAKSATAPAEGDATKRRGRPFRVEGQGTEPKLQNPLFRPDADGGPKIWKGPYIHDPNAPEPKIWKGPHIHDPNAPKPEIQLLPYELDLDADEGADLFQKRNGPELPTTILT